MNAQDMLSTRAQTALVLALRQGQLRAGQFLSMPQLVDMLDMPLAAVREATRHGSTAGWLQIIPKRGVQIMDAVPELIQDSLDMRMMLDQEGARRRIRDAQLADLPDLRQAHEDILQRAMGRALPDLSSRAILVDLSLHDYLAAGLANPLLRDAYDANRIRIAIIQRVRPFVQERVVSAMQEHLAIMDALQARDESAAVQAIAHHCDRTRHWWGVPG